MLNTDPTQSLSTATTDRGNVSLSATAGLDPNVLALVQQMQALTLLVAQHTTATPVQNTASEQNTLVIYPKVFSNASKQHVSRWVLEYERCALANEWDDVRKVALLPRFLGEGPPTFYENQSRISGLQTWNDWKDSLLSKYRPANHEALALQEANRRRMRLNEDPDTFFDEMIALLYDADPTMGDHMKLFYLERSLQSPSAFYVAEQT